MLSLFTFTYWSGPKAAFRRVLFVWSGRSREESDEAFEEVVGAKPDDVGCVVEVKRVR